MARKLKVFRTAIGFHDAYVAAPSQKAALEAWGANNNLFAIGSAEVVTDATLTKEPLASPSKVIKLVRGSLEQHLSAAADTNRKAPAARKRRTTPAAKAPRPKPRPSRDKLDEAEAALAELRDDAETEMKAFDRREQDLRTERQAAEARQAKAIAQSEREIARVRSQYEKALDRWRQS